MTYSRFVLLAEYTELFKTLTADSKTRKLSVKNQNPVRFLTPISYVGRNFGDNLELQR